jgi:hypothetical protein
MLLTTLATVAGIQIGKHPFVTKLMYGIFNLNPPKTKYQSTWNVDIVLDYLKKSQIINIFTLSLPLNQAKIGGLEVYNFSKRVTKASQPVPV